MQVENPIEIARYGTKEMWHIHPVNKTFSATERDVDVLVKVCNEPAIYDILFRKKLNGVPYTAQNAYSLINWAKQGWKDQTRFSFLVRDTNNQIAASIDIKSNNLSNSEIGYWATMHEPGIMTNTVLAICQLAKNNGYHSLYGLVRKDNPLSVVVLTRAGFELTGEELRKDRDDHVYCTYTLDLTQPNIRIGTNISSS